MSRPLDLPPADAYEHGTRARYVGGCRCASCRAANSRYGSSRVRAKAAGDWNGLVPAARARAHIEALRAEGVGLRTVADVSGVARSVLAALVSGQRTALRARSERAILDVSAEAGLNGAKLLPAEALLARLEAVRVARGWTRRELARRLGYQGNALQFRPDRMTARNIARVERFLRQLDQPPPAPSPKVVLRRVRELLALPNPWEGRDELADLARACGLPDEGDPSTLAAAIRRHLHRNARA